MRHCPPGLHHLRALATGVALVATGMVLAACASPASTSGAGPSPTRTGTGSPDTWTGTGLLTRKGSDAFSWWALQTDSGEVWQLELPPTLPTQALQTKQNCRMQASGQPGAALLGTKRLRVSSLSAVPRLELGAPENQRCRYSLPAP